MNSDYLRLVLRVSVACLIASLAVQPEAAGQYNQPYKPTSKPPVNYPKPTTPPVPPKPPVYPPKPIVYPTKPPIPPMPPSKPPFPPSPPKPPMPPSLPKPPYPPYPPVRPNIVLPPPVIILPPGNRGNTTIIDTFIQPTNPQYIPDQQQWQDPGTSPSNQPVNPPVQWNDSSNEQDGGAQSPPSIDDLNAAITNDPNNPGLYFIRAGFWIQQSEFAAAITDFNRTIQLDPSSADAYNGRGWLLATCTQPAVRNGAQAYRDAYRACELTQWANAGFVDTLAAASAENGDFANAIKLEEFAMNIQGVDPNQLQQFRSNLYSFQNGQPIRE